MLILGLTGGIATGKSTVSSILASSPYNFPVIDADHIAREIVQPGRHAYRRIVAHFSPVVPDLLLPADPQTGEQALNRAALGRYVFANEKERRVLNFITHPEVRRAMALKAMYWWLIKISDIVVLDVPLLFESRLDLFCAHTLVIACNPEIQRDRLLARDGAILSTQEADERIKSQMAIEEKAWYADSVIWNDTTIDELRIKVRHFIDGIRPARSRTLIEWILPIGLFMGFLEHLKRRLAASSKRVKFT
ncbi:dephospho-CoA kinase-domain-containing protein [Lipomyces oligophaga]|uniref:dephospho-CoA kinase-domain-containing protein n=1 Tax=Lipomyces oligophaga TaxID=45792 RepID=UPI0034CED6F6